MILILAGVVLGPQKIRQVAFWLGRFTAQVRAISQQFTAQLNAELDALDAEDVREMQAAVEELKNLRSEVSDLQRQLRFRPDRITGEGRRAIAEGERVLRGEASLQRERSLQEEEPVREAREQPATAPHAPQQEEESIAADEATVFQPDRLPTPVPVADDPES